MIRLNFGIAGGIGSGKSTLINALQQIPWSSWSSEFFVQSFITYHSTDKIVDDLYKDETWLKWLDKNFGTRDRKEISQKAFASKDVKDQLESHSSFKVGIQLGKILGYSGIHVIEFPLLFETGSQGHFDKTILITADMDTRIERVVARGSKTHEEARLVINSQMPEKDKRALADYVIDTSTKDVAECAHDLMKIITTAVGEKSGY